MKVVGLSDIHGQLIRPDQLDHADVYCICGDIVPLDIQRHYEKSIAWIAKEFLPWCESLPCQKVFFIAGNHDFVLERLRTNENGEHRKANRVLGIFGERSGKVRYLENSGGTFNGYKIWGTPWIQDLSNWAFYLPQDQFIKELKKIPEDTDILLTHQPPRVSQYGMVLEPGFNCMTDYGSIALADRIKEIKPKLSLFGHVHSGLHTPETIEGTTYCNVSVKDERYKSVYFPRIIEI